MSQSEMPDRPLSLEEIVAAGLCIGCGLCRSLAGAGRVDMVTTPEGRERPVAREPLDGATLAAINAVCPGTWIEGADPAGLPADARADAVWGPVTRLAIAHAADPEVRHLGASGGVLTALGQYLLATGEVELVLHVKAREDAPMRSAATVSATPQEVWTRPPRATGRRRCWRTCSTCSTAAGRWRSSPSPATSAPCGG